MFVLSLSYKEVQRVALATLVFNFWGQKLIGARHATRNRQANTHLQTAATENTHHTLVLQLLL